MGYAYAALAAAATTDTTPDGWDDDWPIPDSDDDPWPPNWPATAVPPTGGGTSPASYTMSVEVSETTIGRAINSALTVVGTTLLSAANTDDLLNHVVRVSAATASSTISLSKTSGGTYATNQYYQVSNYAGSAYGISQTIYFDTSALSGGETLTVTVTIMSTTPNISGSDTVAVVQLALTGIATIETFGTLTLTAVGEINHMREAPSISHSAYKETVDTHHARTSLAGGRVRNFWNAGLVSETDGGNGYIQFGIDYSGSSALNDKYARNGDSWSTLTDGTLARANLGGCVIASKIYSFKGLTSGVPDDATLEYAIGTDAWAAKTDAPAPIVQSAAVFGNATDGFVVGGRDSGVVDYQDCDAYNQSGNSWSGKTDIPTPERRSARGTLLDGMGYIAGGFRTSSGGYLSDFDEYNVSGNSWSSKTDVPSPARAGIGVTKIGDSDNIYATAGQRSGGYSGDHHAWTQASDTWTAKTGTTSTTQIAGAFAWG